MTEEINLTDENIPDSVIYGKLLDAVNHFLESKPTLPPVTMDELHVLTDLLIEKNGELKPWKNWLLVMFNNVIWQDVVASIPHHRRMLLLPQCLRNSKECQAPMDEYGLLCEGCGNCELAALQNEADRLKTMCLIAEGSTIVGDLLESGSVDAVIGVGCLEALEKSFPHMVKHAIPGLAIPLFSNGCKDTMTDLGMVKEAIQSHDEKSFLQINVKDLLKDVRAWFNEKELAQLLGDCPSRTDKIARDWLILSGRRFRPFLVTAVAHSLGINDFEKDNNLKKLALAVECFHKASLIHDDIEDDDNERYGEPALHKKWGIPIALNIGDLLLGEGYRLISELDISEDKRSHLLRLASTRHLALCRGQGEEFLLQKDETSSIEKVLEIFQNKTSPAFEVALIFGLIYGEGDHELYPIIYEFSKHLGIAFQILDDFKDEDDHKETKNKASIIQTIKQAKTLSQEEARYEGWTMYQQYRNQTLQTLKPLKNYPLKRLLFQVTMRILHDVEEPK